MKPKVSVAEDPTRPRWWNNDKWGTPRAFVRQVEHYLDQRFSLDVCASKRMHKCTPYYTVKEDGLHSPWNGRVWCNPPYSNPAPWCRRAAKLTYNGTCPLAVLLLPPSVDTQWFHRWVLPYAEIHFVKDRIAFLDWNGRPMKGTRQGSIVAIYRAGTTDVQKPIVYHSHTFLADPTRST